MKALAKALRQPSAEKVREVEKIRSLVKGRRVVGVFDLTGMPSSQLQDIRKKLRGKAELVVTKTLLFKKALEELQELRGLDVFLKGSCGLIVSDEEPFRLYRLIKKNKSRAAAKPGAAATADILVPAGETDIPAGPALAEFKAVKIDVKLDKGKISVVKDSLVAKKGEVITPQVASALAKLGLRPVEVRLNVAGFCEKGTVYSASVLDVDEEALIRNIGRGYAEAVSLSLASAYPARGTVGLLLNKAVQIAFNLAGNAGIITSQTISLVLGRAFSHASALAAITSVKQGG